MPSRPAKLVEQPRLGVEAAEGSVTGEGFVAAEVGADRGLAEQAEGADLGAVGRVGAAAELAGEVADIDYPDRVAVLV